MDNDKTKVDLNVKALALSEKELYLLRRKYQRRTIKFAFIDLLKALTKRIGQCLK